MARERAEEAREEADEARDVADLALREADEAKAEAERIRREAEAELNRLEEALSKIADTRRTALGLVMNLGEDALKFDFDKSELRSENRELLARITGILLTSPDYTISVNGHTDDVGKLRVQPGLVGATRAGRLRLPARGRLARRPAYGAGLGQIEAARRRHFGSGAREKTGASSSGS